MWGIAVAIVAIGILGYRYLVTNKSPPEMPPIEDARSVELEFVAIGGKVVARHDQRPGMNGSLRIRSERAGFARLLAYNSMGQPSTISDVVRVEPNVPATIKSEGNDVEIHLDTVVWWSKILGSGPALCVVFTDSEESVARLDRYRPTWDQLPKRTCFDRSVSS